MVHVADIGREATIHLLARLDEQIHELQSRNEIRAPHQRAISDSDILELPHDFDKLFLTLARAAAAWSCVLKQMQEHQHTLAPMACIVSTRTPVWMVTCKNQALLIRRMPSLSWICEMCESLISNYGPGVWG